MKLIRPFAGHSTDWSDHTLSGSFLSSLTKSTANKRVNIRAVWIFCLVTVALSVALFYLLPGLAAPALAVFIPALMASALIALTEGSSQVRARLFSGRAWRINLRWGLISVGTAVALCLGVILARLLLVPGYAWQPGSVSPLLLFVFIAAAAEEIGWRGYALLGLLSWGYQPLSAALALGIPWALLHMPLVLPGMVNAGAPALAQFLLIVALSILLTWVYLGSGNSLSAAVLLHGTQNLLGIVALSLGVSPLQSGWLNAGVYASAALLVIILTRGRLGLPAGRQEDGPGDRQYP